MIAAAAILLAILLVVIGLLHIGWAVGVYWPFSTLEEVAKKVLSDASTVPPAPLTALVGILLIGAGYLALAVHWVSLRFVPDWMYVWGIWGLAAVLLLRGIVDPVINRNGSQEYKRLNLWIYTPLCVVLASLAAVTVLG